MTTIGQVLNAYLNDCEWPYTSQIVILTIANCQAGKPYPPVAVRFLGMKGALYFRFLPC